jgi:alanine dehydrogenase
MGLRTVALFLSNDDVRALLPMKECVEVLEAIKRAGLIAVDNLENAKAECGELIWAAERGWFRWTQPVELHEIVSGKVDGYPSPDTITLFESQGIGIEDVAASAYILKKARAQGVGIELPF